MQNRNKVKLGKQSERNPNTLKKRNLIVKKEHSFITTSLQLQH